MDQSGTLQGALIKARAVEWCQGGEFDGFGQRDSATDMQLAESLIRDLLNMAAPGGTEA